MHLYEITDQFRELTLLAESDELPADVIRDTLESITADWDQKAEAVAAYIKNIEAVAEAKKDAAKQLQERSNMLQKRADSLRMYLLLQFQATGKTLLETDRFTLILKNSPPAVAVDDETLIPAAYFVQKPPPPPSLDKKAISAAFKLGVEIPGCHVEQNQRVDIQI